MLKWVQSGISAVTGIAEPEYGREAIHPVTDGLQGKKVYSTLKPQDFYWQHPDQTNVETQTFYFNCFESGYMGFAQVIYSDMVGLYTTAQQTFKLFHKDTPNDYIWTSTKLENFKSEGANFYADGFKIELNEDGNTYHFKSEVCPESIIDLTIVRVVDGVKFGENGTTYYGDNIEDPWGTMRHVFWPRNDVSGTIVLNPKKEDDGEEGEESTKQASESVTHNIKGKSMFVMALQGMKPHHAAAAWNFMNFVSEKHSVVIMEFTTPKSYATTKVNIAIVTNDKEIISCAIDSEVKHLESKIDEVGWPVPSKLECNITGFLSSDDLVEKLEADPESVTKISATVKGSLDHLSERVDVMAEIPTFVKNIVSGVVGTKPYIYQFCNPMTLSISNSVNDDVVDEPGVAYSEASFISAISN